MATSYHVTVKYDATNGNLSIIVPEERDLVLAPNTSAIHSLVWEFEGIEGLVAAGWAPGIKFELAPELGAPRYSGPFTHLTRTSSAVIACGNTGQGGKYRYRAILEPPTKSALSMVLSVEACLYNQVPEPTAATLRVTPVPGTKGLLQIQPEAVSYYAGQSLFWEVVEAPEDIGNWYPRIVFDHGPGDMNSHLGPFTSLETRDKSLLGAGSAGRPGRYNYVFQMVSVESGEVLFESTTDPTVDDEGDPTGGTSGG